MSASTESPFAFAAPPVSPSSTPAPLSSPFSPLALFSSPSTVSPTTIELAESLLALRTLAAYKHEIGALGGELRDEWRGRIAGLKGDYMARIIPDDADADAEDDDEGDDVPGEGQAEQVEGAEPMVAPEVGSEQPEEGDESVKPDESVKSPPPSNNDAPAAAALADTSPLLIPTIISDHDSIQAMSSRVDTHVEAEFAEHMQEAEGRLRGAVLRRETMELEVFLGGLVLQSLEVANSDEVDAEEMLADNLQQELGELGWDGVPLKLSSKWDAEGVLP
ncbi:hypothetical protein RQP46_010969 [Phenoliferia psychrophenolica]